MRHAEALRLRLLDLEVFFFGTAMTSPCETLKGLRREFGAQALQVICYWSVFIKRKRRQSGPSRVDCHFFIVGILDAVGRKALRVGAIAVVATQRRQRQREHELLSDDLADVDDVTIDWVDVGVIGAIGARQERHDEVEFDGFGNEVEASTAFALPRRGDRRSELDTRQRGVDRSVHLDERTLWNSARGDLKAVRNNRCIDGNLSLIHI